MVAFDLYYDRWEAEISRKKQKAPGHSYPNSLTKKMYLSAMTAKSSAEMAPVKAVWMLVTSSRSSVCVSTRTHGLQGLIEYCLRLA